MQNYNFFKVFSNFNRIFEILTSQHEGKSRFVFFLDDGEFCERLHFAGYSVIYVKTDEELYQLTDTLSHIRLSGNCIFFPCCYKETNDAIAGALDDRSHFAAGAWKSIFTKQKTREYYHCNPEELEAAADALAERYAAPNSAKINVLRFSEIEINQTDWLWHPYIAKGNITILFAAPGAGKTFFTCWLAARLSNGEALPGMPPEEWESPAHGITLFFNAEDPADKTLKPRLEGCGADMSNIATAENWNSAAFVPYSFTDPRLPNLFEKIRPELVIFDPMQSYIGADTDMHRANQTRPILTHINALAQAYNFAAVIVCHTNKMVNQSIGERIMGSQDIKGAARSVLFLGCHPELPEVKVMFQTKNNLAKWGDPLAFKITEENGIPRFFPSPETDISGLTAEKCTGSASDRAPAAKITQKSIAEEIIQELFKTNDIVYADEFKEAIKENGISWREFRKVLAKKTIWKKQGFGPEARYCYIKRT